MDDVAAVAARLTAAQRAAVNLAFHSHKDGAWHPEGFYCRADKRVRYALCTAGIIRDYLRATNMLTPRGLAVRARLTSEPKSGLTT